MAALIENRPSFSATKVWMVREAGSGHTGIHPGEHSGASNAYSRFTAFQNDEVYWLPMSRILENGGN